MEGETNARVFFRGFALSQEHSQGLTRSGGVSADPSELRLHILVKGDAPAQAKHVRRLVRDILCRLEPEMSPLSRVTDILAGGVAGSRHPFLCTVPLQSIFAEPHPSREYRLPFQFKISTSKSGLAGEVERWSGNVNSKTLANSTCLVPVTFVPQDAITSECTLALKGLPLVSQTDAKHPLVNAVQQAFMGLTDRFPAPYFFEPHELVATQNAVQLLGGGSAGTVLHLAAGEPVRLSESAAAHFALLLLQGELLPDEVLAGFGLVTETQEGREATLRSLSQALLCLRGTVRLGEGGGSLVSTLLHPWAPYSDMHKNTQSQLPRTEEEIGQALEDCDQGLVGSKKEDGGKSYVGYLVEWRIPTPLVEQMLYRSERGLGTADERVLRADLEESRMEKLGIVLPVDIKAGEPSNSPKQQQNELPAVSSTSSADQKLSELLSGPPPSAATNQSGQMLSGVASKLPAEQQRELALHLDRLKLIKGKKGDLQQASLNGKGDVSEQITQLTTIANSLLGKVGALVSQAKGKGPTPSSSSTAALETQKGSSSSGPASSAVASLLSGGPISKGSSDSPDQTNINGQTASGEAAASSSIAGPVVMQYVGSLWLPEEVYAAPDLKDRIAGAENAHFAHIKERFPRSTVGFFGDADVTAQEKKRLRVVVTSEGAEMKQFRGTVGQTCLNKDLVFLSAKMSR